MKAQLAIISAAVIVTACAPMKSTRSSEEGELYSSGKIRLAAAPQIDDIARQIGVPDLADQLRAGNLPANTPIYAEIEKGCLAVQAALSEGLGSQYKDLLDKFLNGNLDKEIPGLDLQAYAIELPENVKLEDLKKALDGANCIKSIGINYKLQAPDDMASGNAVFTADPQQKDQKYLEAIRAAEGWEKFYGGANAITQDVLVAVVDTGVDYRHKDLQANMFRSSSGTYGYDFVAKDSDPMDEHGHGTHIAGLIGAVGANNIGLAGVMPKHVKIMAVRVLNDKKTGTLADIVNGIRYAADQKAEVINVSIGTGSIFIEYQQAIQYAANKGSLVFISAGNDGKQISYSNPYVPCMFAKDIAGAACVGSNNVDDGAKSSFSNWSTTFVQLTAPGAMNNSTGLVGLAPNDGLISRGGTSMSTPIAAAAAGLVVGILKSNGKSFTNANVMQVLKSGSATSSSLANSFEGGRKIDILKLADTVLAKYFDSNPQPQPQPSPTPAPAPAPTPVPRYPITLPPGFTLPPGYTLPTF